MCFGTQNCCHGNSSQTTVISIKSISFYSLAYLSFVRKKRTEKSYSILSNFFSFVVIFRVLLSGKLVYWGQSKVIIGWSLWQQLVRLVGNFFIFIILTEFVIIFQIFMLQQMQSCSFSLLFSIVFSSNSFFWKVFGLLFSYFFLSTCLRLFLYYIYYVSLKLCTNT